MAVQQVHVFRCTVFLKSKLGVGAGATQRGGEPVNVIALTPAAAVAVLQSVYGSDFVRANAPVLAVDNAYTTMTGS